MKQVRSKHKEKLVKCGVLVLVVLMLVTSTVFATSSNDTGEKTGTEATSSASLDKLIPLTKEEKAYQKEHPTIVVAADASWRPIEYVDDKTGDYTGVIQQILDKIGYYTSFKIEYKIMNSYDEALKAVQSGEADMVSGLANDEDMAADYNVILSKPFLQINSAIVSKEVWDNIYSNSKKKKIAVVSGDFANDEIDREIPNSELIMCSSNSECLNKVKNDEADMAILASYCVEYYMGIPKYSTLKSHTISDFSWDLSLGINENADPLLKEIINKGIGKLSEVDVNEAVYRGITDAAYDNDVLLFVYKHPIGVIGGILLLVVIFGALLLVIIRSKKKAHIRKIEDGTRLSLALQKTHLCIWELDMKTQEVKKIDNEQEKHGFKDLRENIPESVIEAGYVHPEDIPELRKVLEKVKAGEQDVKGCWRIRENEETAEETSYWWEQVIFHTILDERNKPVSIIGVSEDVTKEKMSQRDSLTLVFNRNSFEEKTSSILNERRHAYLQCAYMILDLDGFKKINDTYGHGMGDQVLIAVGSVLKKTFRTTDIVGRMGGDEFTVFMTSISKGEDAIRKASELIENIRGIQKEEGFEFPVACSLGIVITEKGKDDLPTLYKKADTALYEAKRAGKNQYKLYKEI